MKASILLVTILGMIAIKSVTGGPIKDPQQKGSIPGEVSADDVYIPVSLFCDTSTDKVNFTLCCKYQKYVNEKTSKNLLILEITDRYLDSSKISFSF